MTRPAKARLGFRLATVLLAALVLPLVVVGRDHPLLLVPVMVLLLIPGRMQGVLYRDLFRGRRGLALGQTSDAIAANERFLEQLAARPWLKHAIWLARWTWTPDPGAMAENNLGTAYLGLGDLDRAERYYADALRRDPLYPIPWCNRAAIATVRGRVEERDHALAWARELGYTGNLEDRATALAQELLASVEGR